MNRGFMLSAPLLLRKLSIAVMAALAPVAAFAAGEAKQPHGPTGHGHADWVFSGPLGHYDKASMQRGFKVYREVCAACHSVRHLSFRDLGQEGGPFDVEECYAADPDDPTRKIRDPARNLCVKAIAAEYQVPAGPDEFGNTVDESGAPLMRTAKPADRIPEPYQNEIQARAANGGALPPDLSLITKARHRGPDYVYSLITGYEDPPEGLKVADGQYYNPYFPGDLSSDWSGDKSKTPPGGVITMAPPLLADGQVTYDDGTESTIPQMTYDLVNFLHWAAEPRMEARKQMGLSVLAYLVLLSLLLYWSYRRVWRNVEH